MKKVVLASVLVFLFSGLYSQVGFGIRGGLNFSSLPVDVWNMNGFEIESLEDTYTGWHLGAVSQINIYKFFIQPELLFVSTGNYMRLKETGQDDFFFKQYFTKIDLPVMMGVKFGPLRLGAGPVGSYILGNSSELEESDRFQNIDFREKFNSLTYGFQLGVGFDLSNILLDFKYEGSLNKWGNGIDIGETNYPFDTRPRQFILSIGLLF